MDKRKPVEKRGPKAKGHLKYAKDWDQAVKFVKTKPRLPEGALKAFVVSPLADSYFLPDTVHFYCDNMQAYHLLVDYMAAMDIHPLHSNLTVNSAACLGEMCSLISKNLRTLFLPAAGPIIPGKWKEVK